MSDIAEKLTTIAENEQKIYDKGVSDEVENVTNRIINADGDRNSWTYAFAFANWSGYKFSQPIVPKRAFQNMFYNCIGMTELPTPIDFSELCTEFNWNGASYDAYAYRRSVFAYCPNLKEIDLSPTGLNMRAIGGIEEWFLEGSALETIQGLNVHKDTIYNVSTFAKCNALMNLTFADEAVIGLDINFKDCSKLSAKSLDNIVSHLYDYSTEAPNTHTLTLHANCWTDELRARVTALGWKALPEI